MVSFHANWNREYLDKVYVKYLNDGFITAAEIDIIRQFTEEREAAQNITICRVVKLTYHLMHWRHFIHKPYTELKLPDVYKAITELKAAKNNKGKPYKQNTLHDFIMILKIFLPWLVKAGYADLPLDQIKAIKVPQVDSDTTDPKDILTPDEIKRLIGGCLWSRDRAIIATIYEAGCRVGEIARLRWGDLIFDEYGIKVNVTDTKTKKRRFARITIFKEYLITWKNDYPGEITETAPVFISWRKVPLKYGTVLQIFNRAAERVGLEKHLHTHLFRKSRAVHMIKAGYQESVIKLSLWGNINTDMFQTYVRLGAEDIDKELLERAGVPTPTRAADEHITIRTCERCAAQNMPTAGYCCKCGYPLTEENVALFAELKKRSTEDPEFMIRYYTAVKEGRI
jgi:integrase/ribosomal protein L40E